MNAFCAIKITLQCDFGIVIQIKPHSIWELQDSVILFPSYGNLGSHLLFRNSSSMLILLDKFFPLSIKAIKTNLKLDDGNLNILQGEHIPEN
ncbi:uncharacterized protein VP01_1088g2 [Puccinia sorghi]|uniref:Uncharacterized protein n=1 Tax=Puccinia sorghi TaxID=27349 RepID=A0A0L6VUJ5_9BASI|nr:uncharacterized protein VP01_1088g2 [Puccinia sorghi]